MTLLKPKGSLKALLSAKTGGKSRVGQERWAPDLHLELNHFSNIIFFVSANPSETIW